MKLSEAREHYYYFSGKLSDISRQLCFAGIAVVWIFAVKEGSSSYHLPPELLWPLGFFVFGLALDLLHYGVAAASWGIIHRLKESSGVGEEADIRTPAKINYVPVTFFWAKVCATLIGYVLLLSAFVS